jgi:hypothetical protein
MRVICLDCDAKIRRRRARALVGVPLAIIVVMLSLFFALKAYAADEYPKPDVDRLRQLLKDSPQLFKDGQDKKTLGAERAPRGEESPVLRARRDDLFGFHGHYDPGELRK